MEALTIGDCCICGVPQESGTQCPICKAIFCYSCIEHAAKCEGCDERVCWEHIEYRDVNNRYMKLCSICREIED